MYKFNRILCPTDFSPASLEMIQVATFAAERFEGTITLLYVDEYIKSPEGYFSKANHSEYYKKIQSFADEKFNDVITNTNLDRARIKFIVKYGTAYQEIITEAEKNEYSAIAISTNGIGCSSPHLIGRTTERVVRLSRTPVLTARPSSSPREGRVSTILCPTDFSEYGNYALPYAISIARHFSAKLILLHVTGLSTEHSERLIESFPDLTTYHEQVNEVSIERIVDKDIEPANAIVRISQEYRADLIVIGTHGAKGLHRVQIGNTTEEVIQRVEVPTLSVTHPVHKIIFPHRFREEYLS